MRKIITLITDFGDSLYVGAMKGVIASTCPDANVIDITHGIRKFDARQAAYELYAASPYFPRGTIHCVVVDPSVGTSRRGVIVETKNYLFVGPDNGTFSLVRDIKRVYELESGSASATFHGRDVFAPAAAKLACGKKPSSLGRRVERVKKIIGEPMVARGRISGEVITADSFGNVITNIRKEDLERAGMGRDDRVKLSLKGRVRKIKLVRTYGDSRKGMLVCLVGSAGHLEIAVNQGNANSALRTRGGERLVMEK